MRERRGFSRLRRQLTKATVPQRITRLKQPLTALGRRYLTLLTQPLTAMKLSCFHPLKQTLSKLKSPRFHRLTQPHALRGFSLLELLITVTIIGALVLCALPAYTQHIIHERRIEAETALEKLAASLEQYAAINDTYRNATLPSLGSAEFVAKNTYRLSISAATDTDFSLQAIPEDTQAQKDALCATLTLNSKGEKGITGQGNVDDCW